MIVSLMGALLSLPVVAAHPFATDDAGTLSATAFEAELCSDYWKNSAAFGFSLNHGLTERMDMGIGICRTQIPYYERELSGLELGLKFSLIPDFLALTASGELGGKSYSVNSIVSKAWGSVAMDANLGLEVYSNTNQQELMYGLCLTCPIGSFSVGAELGGTQKALSWVLGGVRYALNDLLIFDIGLGNDLNGSMVATTGMTIAFPVRFEKQ